MRIALLILLPFQSFGQGFYYDIDFPKFSVPPRPVYIKYMEKTDKLAFVDYREGLFVSCDSVMKSSQGKKINLRPFLFGRFWHIVESPEIIDRGILIYIPDNSDLNNWNEMITVQRIDSEGQKSAKFYNSMLKSRIKQCGDQIKSEIIDKSGNHILYKTQIKACQDADSQTELSIILHPDKLIMFQYTIWKIEFITRDNIQPAQQSEIIKWLSGIELIAGKEVEKFITN